MPHLAFARDAHSPALARVEGVDHEHTRSHARPRRPSKTGMNLNVTSMVDILFNLLVYFIVTANFTIDEGSLKAKLPPPAVVEPGRPEPLQAGAQYFIDVGGTHDGYGCVLLFNGKLAPDFAALRSALSANNVAKKAGGTINPALDTLVIRPGAKVRWQHVVNAFNQTVAAGYAKVSFGQQ